MGTSRTRTFDCPVCFEEMKPPTKIFQCIEGHSICERCKNMVNICPTCRTDMGPGRVSRNRLAESIIRERVEGGNSDHHQASAPPLEDTIGSSVTSEGLHEDEEVASMLESLQLDNLRPIFAEEELHMKDIAKLTKEDLKDIGIKKIKDRISILDEAKRRIDGKSNVTSPPPQAPSTSSQPSKISSFRFGKSDVKVKTEERSAYILISTPDASQYRWKAAECLGQYQVAGNHDGTVYYQQLHTVDTVDYTIYCYRQAGKWWASQRLGAEYGNLCCEEGGPYPPARGWRYMYGSWRDDPLLSVQDGLSLCQGATVSVSGNTELSQDIAGEYFLVAGQYRLGRVMMKHRSKDRFLVFWHGWAGGSWRVEDKVSDGSSSVIAFSLGGRMTVCPGQDNNTKWWDNRRIGYATVTVKCHTHN